MSVYPQYRPQRKLWGINAMGSVVVEVESENGAIGVGTIEATDVHKSAGYIDVFWDV